jgi:putative MFS transporter
VSAIAARLERLPLSGFHRKLLLIGGLGYMFDGLDSSSLAFLLPVVSKLWHLTSAETGLVASSTYIGYFFGAFLSGVLADVIGRRRIMMSALAIYCCASLASATATDWHTFFVLRIVAGFGSGAETVVTRRFWPSSCHGVTGASFAAHWSASCRSAIWVRPFSASPLCVTLPKAGDIWRWRLRCPSSCSSGGEELCLNRRAGLKARGGPPRRTAS